MTFSVGEPEPELVKKIEWARAGAGKNSLKTAPNSRESGLFEPEKDPVKEIYKNSSKDPGAMPFL